MSTDRYPVAPLPAPAPGDEPWDQPILPDAPAMEPPPMERRTPNLTPIRPAPRKHSVARRLAGVVIPVLIVGGIGGLTWYAYGQFQDDGDPVPPGEESPAVVVQEGTSGR